MILGNSGKIGAALVLMVALSGCNTYTGEHQLETAKTLCEPNDGVHSILTEHVNGASTTVNCKNGAQFEFRSDFQPWKKSYNLEKTQ